MTTANDWLFSCLCVWCDVPFDILVYDSPLWINIFNSALALVCVWFLWVTITVILFYHLTLLDKHHPVSYSQCWVHHINSTLWKSTWRAISEVFFSLTVVFFTDRIDLATVLSSPVWGCASRPWLSWLSCWRTYSVQCPFFPTIVAWTLPETLNVLWSESLCFVFVYVFVHLLSRLPC